MPFQIDQRAYKDLSDKLVTCIDGEPECACDPMQTCNGVVCEESYVWTGEDDSDDPSTAVNSLDDNDEIVLLVKDAGDKAPSNSWISGSTKRYEVRIADRLDLATAFVYLYEFGTTQTPFSPAYMTYTRDSQTEETIVEGNCNDNLIGYDTYQTRLVKNWSIRDLKTRAVTDNSGQAQCADYANRTDVLDRLKWRMGAETEEGWNGTSTFLGDKHGPVRAVRGSIGAMSGYGTTHYYSFYPTQFREEVHLRVHPLLGKTIRGYPDFVSAAFAPGTCDPLPCCQGSDLDIHREHASLPTELDEVDGAFLLCPTDRGGDAYTPRQMNGSHASIAEVIVENPDHPMRLGGAMTTHLGYNDNSMAPPEPSVEDEAGAYGNISSEWPDMNSTEERECPGDPPDPDKLFWSGLTRIWQLKTTGSLLTDASALDNNERLNPLEITSYYQEKSTSGGGPPTPCVVDLQMNDPENGYRGDGTIGSCEPGLQKDDLWTEIWKAGATGPFSFYRDLRKDQTFFDFDIERNATYRYYAVTYNSDGDRSAASNIETITIADTTNPMSPVITGTVTGNSATLSWAFGDEFDMHGYNVYRSTTAGGPYNKLTLGGPVRSTSYTAQLPDPVTYYFVVRSVDQGGLDSVDSNEVALAAE